MYLLLLNLMDGPPAEAADEEQVQRLVSLARDGDEIAARRLYRMFVARVYRAVRPLAVTDADAEDVVQDSFVKALGSLDRYQRQPGKRFVAWLVTIALNNARKQARRQQRWRPLPADQSSSSQSPSPGDTPPSEPDSLGPAMDRQRLVMLLLEALAELPDRERHIVLLRYGAELTATEVGQICGEAPATVRKICQRQRERLLQRLSRNTSAHNPASSRAGSLQPAQESNS